MQCSDPGGRFCIDAEKQSSLCWWGSSNDAGWSCNDVRFGSGVHYALTELREEERSRLRQVGDAVLVLSILKVYSEWSWWNCATSRLPARAVPTVL